MTNAARDDREIAPYDMTLAGGPEGLALAPEGDPTDLTYYTRAQVGPGPEDVQWTPIVDPAEIAAIQGAVAQGIDPPYEVWADQAPAAFGPGDLTPTVTPTSAEEGPAVYAWEQTGPAVGEGQLYEVTDPVVIAAYEEAHPLAPSQGAIEIANPADYYEAAASPEPLLYGAQIDALAYTGDTWLAVEQTGAGFVLGRYEAGPFEGDTNAWEPRRVGDGPDDGPTGNAYPDEAAAWRAAIAYNGADLAGPPLDLDPGPAPIVLDRDLTPALDL